MKIDIVFFFFYGPIMINFQNKILGVFSPQTAIFSKICHLRVTIISEYMSFQGHYYFKIHVISGSVLFFDAQNFSPENFLFKQKFEIPRKKKRSHLSKAKLIGKIS